jgi:Fic family protein
MQYNWQQSDWPDFRYDLSEIQDALVALGARMGSVSGSFKALGDADREQVQLNLMVAEALKTSEIEGEYFSRADIMSSVRNNLGLNEVPEPVGNKAAQGVADLTVTVRTTFEVPLSEQVLLDWHKMLLGTSDSLRKINVGAWRTHAEPMQIISGNPYRPTIHFEAPPSTLVPAEVKRFVQWFNDTGPGRAHAISFAPVRSALTHLYFESIHPFEDGNGRIGRALAEKALAQSLGFAPVLSLSSAIEANKNAYYSALQMAQSSNIVTPWISWFVDIVVEAQREAEAEIDFTIDKARFFDRHGAALNERQRKVVRRMLREGRTGFEGGMSTKKYCIIADTSRATAARDLEHLTNIGAFHRYGGGRSTRYDLALGARTDQSNHGDPL